MATLAEQLRDAAKADGVTFDQLLERSGLALTRSGLSRKLSGKTGLSADEAAKLAHAIGRRVVQHGTAFKLRKAA